MTTTTMTTATTTIGTAPSRRRVSRPMTSAAITLLLLLGVLALWPARLGGATRWVIVSGTSMEPGYGLGDLVLTRSTSSVGEGDVVVFAVPDGAGAGQLVIHRIVSVRSDGSFVTQGDNRDTTDEWNVAPADVVGRPVLRVPRAGAVLAGHGGGSLMAPVVGVAATLLLWPRRRRTPRDDGADDDDRADDDRADDIQVAPRRRRTWAPAVGPREMAEAEHWLDQELRRLQRADLADAPLPVRPLREQRRGSPAARRGTPRPQPG